METELSKVTDYASADVGRLLQQANLVEHRASVCPASSSAINVRALIIE
jgi:3-methyladenine DNA glycosylase Tag